MRKGATIIGIHALPQCRHIVTNRIGVALLLESRACAVGHLLGWRNAAAGDYHEKGNRRALRGHNWSNPATLTNAIHADSLRVDIATPCQRGHGCTGVGSKQ